MEMGLKDELIKLARTVGGSFKTRSDRETIVARVADHLRNDLNIQIKQVDQIKIQHIEKYVEYRVNEGISKRSMQNEMAAIRAVLREDGRDQILKQDRLTNRALGLSGASREGAKSAIPADLFQKVISEALRLDKGVAAALLLCKQLGLRSEEGVQSYKSLQTWYKNIVDGNERIKVVFGTKTGRERDVSILPESRNEILTAIKFAVKVAELQGGYLIQKSNLKEAMYRFHNQSRRLGLVGKHSPHSLRYAFARRQFSQYKAMGFTDKESLSLVSQDLGHGDNRGRYIKYVYLK
jgi:hypothetical protein